MLLIFQLAKASQKGDKSYNLALAEAGRNVPLDHEFTFKAPRLTAVLVDKICRVLFPMMFALFNVTYWLHPAGYSQGLSMSDIWTNVIKEKIPAFQGHG